MRIVRSWIRFGLLTLIAICMPGPSFAQHLPTAGNGASAPAGASDIPSTFAAPATGYDYTRREVMIPMRDGVKLFTVIILPKGAHNAPILLTRTPYNAEKRTERFNSVHMLATLCS